MTVKPSDLYNDLHDLVRGELVVDAIQRSLYSTDASLFEIMPLGVCFPRDEEDVQTIVRYAAEHRLSLHARGAGTGLAGESLGAGLILDFTRHFNKIIAQEHDTVQVQPGVICAHLNRYLAQNGRRFAPDSASAETCTIGGMVANNASGSRALRWGYTRDHIRRLRVVGSDSTCNIWGRVPLPPTESEREQLLEPRLYRLVKLLESNKELIQICQPQTTFNRCGYLLQDIVSTSGLEMARLFVGSEGTLGMLTEATLRTVPLPTDRCVLAIGFASLDTAARCVPLCLPSEPTACELLDRRTLALAVEQDHRYSSFITPGVQALMLVEFESERPGAAHQMADHLMHRLKPLSAHGLTAIYVADNQAESDWLWQLRTMTLKSLYSLRGSESPLPFFEDIAVPVEHLPEFLQKLQSILQKHQVTASLNMHAGAGQIHARPLLNPRLKQNQSLLHELAGEIYDVVFAMGGTISSQHAVGLARRPWVEQQVGRLYQLMKEIKQLFDPMSLFNPGKILVDGQIDVTEHWRHWAPVQETPKIELQLVWSPSVMEESANRCNGCGDCRATLNQERMCPIFRADALEEASPRAKANMMRHLLDHTNGLSLSMEEVRQVADLCVNCKMCKVECPSHVGIPKLMLEAKAQYVAENGLSWEEWVLARTESLAAFGSRFSWLTNMVLKSRPLRYLLWKLFGISRRRQLPVFAPQSFMQKAKRKGWTRPLHHRQGLKVAYFVDLYANYNDPDIAEATVAVLHHHGIDVYVPEDQIGCGIAPLAHGDIVTARRMAQRNINLLADLARLGYTIICSEPTAALMLKQDYRDLIDDPDVDRVSQATKELTSFLCEIKDDGRFRRELQPIPCRVGHHVPCHMKVLDGDIAAPSLLKSIPELEVIPMDISCSGMAGTFGFKDSFFELSLAAGKPMLDRLRREDIHFGSTECSACRMQMEHGSRKTTLHPIQYLALSYGLMPKLWDRLLPPSN